MAPMPLLTSAVRRTLCAWWAGTLLVLQAACGPGLGGTGTGPSVDPLTAFNASAVPLCAGELAPSLQCPATTGGTPSFAGTAVVGYAGGAGSARVQARFEGDRVDVQWPCLGQRFSGPWAQVAGQAPRFYGQLEQAGQAAVLASLQVERRGEQLQLQLFDATGVALGEATLLGRLAQAPPAGAAVCGAR
jgi:hypothetical protein